MAVYQFDPAAFVVNFPEFAGYQPTTLTRFFDVAQAVFLDNTDGSPVTDITQRGMMFDLLVAHQAQLAIDPERPAGRLASFSEGSVSGSHEWTGNSPAIGAAWYLQTSYGATYWQISYRFRQAFFRPAPCSYQVMGRSGW